MFGRRLVLLAGLLLLLLCCGSPVWAARYRVVDSNGKPVPAARVSILGRADSVAAGPQGELTLVSEPTPPFELGVFAPSGAWLGSVRVERLPSEGSIQDLALPDARRIEVVVSAPTTPSLLAPPADAVSLIPRREWEQRNPNRLTEIIETLPGVSKSDESTSSVPVIRGLDRGRTLVMLDDGRVTAERRVGPSASYLNPFALENVEVVRGPGTVAYGSDALGGIVHAKTPMPTPGDFGLRYSFTAGTGGTPETTGGVGLNVPVGTTAFGLSFYQRAQSDYESPAGTQDNSAMRDRGLSARWLVPAGATRLWVGYQIDQVREMGKPQADLPTTRTFYPLEDSSRFTLGLDTQDVLGFSSVELRAFGGDYRIVTNRQRRPVGTTPLRNTMSDVDAKDFSVRLLGRRAAGPAGLRVGVDVNGRFGLSALNITGNFDAAGNPTTTTMEVAIEDARRTDWGAFVEGDVPLVADRLTLTAGLRGDLVSTRNTGGYYGDRSTSDGAFSGFATLSFDVARDWKIAAQYSHGFRDPSLSDRYFRGVSGRGFVIGNPDLTAETSNQWDLAVRGRLGPVGVGLFGYVYQIADLVERYPSGTDNLFRNRGEARIEGVELQADWQVSRRLVVRVTGSLSQGNILDDGSWATDILPPTAQLIVEHEPIDGLTWRARFLAMARDDRPGLAEVPIAGYGRLDLSAGYRLSDFLTINVSVRNVFDKAYADSADENNVLAPGRGAILSLAGLF
ncbi:MAG: TonB-dependent receptor [Acidobacteria bacterium]|nr:TonB-dependent receptor [Acidobacteriota bacterium]